MIDHTAHFIALLALPNGLETITVGFSLSEHAGLVRITFPARYEVPELEQLLREIRILLEGLPDRGVRCLADLRAVQTTNAKNRYVVSSFFREHDSFLERKCTKMAVVLRSQLQRGAVTAVLWLKPLPWEVKVFNEEEPALKWLDGVTEPR